MQLKEIYRPIEKELMNVEELLRDSLNGAKNKSISQICSYLLEGKGKRLRPALVLLSGKASSCPIVRNPMLIKIACGIELIHAASLIHDDVIDHSYLRYNKTTINSKWGQDVSIALGDYLYSVAYELISQCGNIDILQCISSATKAMCEGELLQVSERDNLDLLKSRYIIIVKKKTASLFAASCQAGSLISQSQRSLQNAFKGYGLNFGIAFQIIDDYLDIVSEEKRLGKKPGQDIDAGETTLPILNLLKSVPEYEREALRGLISSKRDKESLKMIKTRLLHSGAAQRTKAQASSYIALARKNLDTLSDSMFKRSLVDLTTYMIENNFCSLF
ncbi:MAG: polyprenyl synthetase family protein [Candidatus Omnitrophica bacterium]|nr:polyprenyl synthetase family protein [Candidatus Omnitrophota bacterium]MBU1923167.1 polyprenyl synthetase family protein [Candidatus Omnitrophota bacterium]